MVVIFFCFSLGFFWRAGEKGQGEKRAVAIVEFTRSKYVRGHLLMLSSLEIIYILISIGSGNQKMSVNALSSFIEYNLLCRQMKIRIR